MMRERLKNVSRPVTGTPGSTASGMDKTSKE
jgi:hypothetical protein